LLPISVVGSESIMLVPSMIVLLIIAMLTGERPSWTWALIPATLVLQIAFTMGVGMIVARMGRAFSDLLQALPFILRIWFYASGVFASIDRYHIPPAVHRFLILNPMHAYITLIRYCVTGEMPSAVVHGKVVTSGPVWAMWLSGSVWAVVILVSGLVFFWRAEDRVAN